MRGQTTRRQRFARPATPADLPELQAADREAHVFTALASGGIGATKIYVLARDVVQADKLTRLRFEAQGDPLPPEAQPIIEPVAWASEDMKTAIVSFESVEETAERRRGATP